MKQIPEYGIEDIDMLIADRKKFEEFVYTPIDKALIELKKRGDDVELTKKVSELLGGDVPEPFNKIPRAVFFGHATPNYEIRRFVTVVDALPELKTLFLEYDDDKFVTENDRKFSLGKITFYCGRGKNGGTKIKRTNIIDFNSSNGRMISSIKTLWGQPLMDFHHDFFESTFRSLKSLFYNISPWLARVDSVPKKYYEMIFLLFIKNGILFENFMLDVKESEFTKNVVLPAFLKVIRDTKVKPLIVALEPTEIEGDEFWLCHPNDSEYYLKNKFNIVL